MKDFNLRFYVAIPLIIISLFSIYLGQFYLVILITLIFNLLFIEWNLLIIGKKYPFIFIQLILLIFLIISFYNYNYFFIILFLNLFFIFIIQYYFKINYIYSLIIFYFIISLLSSINIIKTTEGINLFIIIFICVILFDTYSYIFGKLLKGKKLLPKISPKKTFSGLIFGTIFSFITILIINYFYNLFIINPFNILTIIIILFSSFIGDLIESLIKRKLLIKDTSNFLPGHGGIFDRFDSFLFVFIIVNFINLI